MFLCSVVDGLNNFVSSINSHLLSSTLSTLLLSSYFRSWQASLSLNNTCSHKRKEGTSLHIVPNHWRLNLLLCYTCIANKGLQGAVKSWWRVSLLINGAQERCYAAKCREAKLQSCNLTSRLNPVVTQVAADCDCSPQKTLMVSPLLLIMFPALRWRTAFQTCSHSVCRYRQNLFAVNMRLWLRRRH